MATKVTGGNTKGSPKKTRESLYPAFLNVVAETGCVSDACKAIQVSRKTVYGWREADGEFCSDWKYALEDYKDKLQKEADRRAVEGVDHPVTYMGMITATYKDYSDQLLLARLKRLDPEYKDRQQVEHTGDVGLRVIVNTNVDPNAGKSSNS